MFKYLLAFIQKWVGSLQLGLGNELFMYCNPHNAAWKGLCISLCWTINYVLCTMLFFSVPSKGRNHLSAGLREDFFFQLVPTVKGWACKLCRLMSSWATIAGLCYGWCGLWLTYRWMVVEDGAALAANCFWNFGNVISSVTFLLLFMFPLRICPSDNLLVVKNCIMMP